MIKVQTLGLSFVLSIVTCQCPKSGGGLSSSYSSVSMSASSKNGGRSKRILSKKTFRGVGCRHRYGHGSAEVSIKIKLDFRNYI